MRTHHWIVALPAIAISVVGGLLSLAIAAIVVLFATAQTGADGTARVPGLTGEVSVIRDEHGVPHIFAESRLDAWHALGFVHAQDRFFQMEFARRTAAGRLAEIIGRPGLRSDRFMRTLGIHRLAEHSIEALSTDARAAVEAYARGVNAWLDDPASRRPPELIVLGVDPEPWRAADSAAWVRLMALLLSGDWRTEILRARLSVHLDTEQIADLWPGEPDSAPTTLAGLPGLDRAFAALDAAIPDIFPEASASNEWVVAGARSRSGAPMLANDPHLGLSAPGMWHLARIVTPEFTASGAALPGQPFFMVGQNGHLAWGLTTTHADTQDLFIERLNPDDPSQYLVPGGSLPFDEREEEIRVRFAEPERQTVRTTHHGPVVSDISPDSARLAGPGRVIALGFAGLRPDDRTANAFFAMNTAQTPEAFREALDDFHAPMQNVVYAHRDGAFGFAVAGRLPVRPGGAGPRPVPGWTGTHDWQGFVATADLPRSHDGTQDAIVNANNRVVSPTYPHPVSNDWPEGFRAQRIATELEKSERHDMDSFAAIQTDTVSLGALSLRAAMLELLPGARRNIPEARALAAWDGRMARDLAAPLIFAAWAAKLQEMTVADELSELTGRLRGLRVRMLRRMLTARPAWCDDIDTPETETCADITAASFDAALADLREAYGRDSEGWRWGDAHRATFAHPLLRFVPQLAALVSPTVETDGGDHTVNRGTHRMRGVRFDHVHGAGLRAIFDMAQPDAARYMIAPGQSGQFASPHHDDLMDAWRDGRYIDLATDLDTLRRARRPELRLVP
jgi:penicillin amidase